MLSSTRNLPRDTCLGRIAGRKDRRLHLAFRGNRLGTIGSRGFSSPVGTVRGIRRVNTPCNVNHSVRIKSAVVNVGKHMKFRTTTPVLVVKTRHFLRGCALDG